MTQTPRTTRKSPPITGRSPARALTAVVVGLTRVLSAATADARAGRGGSMGSRGARTYQAPPPTNTAPSTAAPMERSVAPQPAPARPGVNSPAAQRPGGFFGRGGFMPGLLGGLLGAGLIGMLFGGGFLAGLGSFAGILGFLLQILLIVFLVRLAMRFFRNRAAGQGAMNRGGMNRSGPAYAGPRPHQGPLNRDGMAPGAQAGAGYGSGHGPAGRPERTDAVGIVPADYEAFEALLNTVQTAYGREDVNTLRGVTTPEMFSYFTEELAENHKRGVVNQTSDVRLLQGDLAESWRENNTEYASVAMRFSLNDVTVERATGRVVEGNANLPVETTEVWTFARPRGGRWALSAIQQAR